MGAKGWGQEGKHHAGLGSSFLASSTSSVRLSQGFQTHLGKTPLSHVPRTYITGTSSCWRPSPHPHSWCLCEGAALAGHSCPQEAPLVPPALGLESEPLRRLPGDAGMELGDEAISRSPAPRSDAAELLPVPSPGPPALGQSTWGWSCT